MLLSVGSPTVIDAPSFQTDLYYGPSDPNAELTQLFDLRFLNFFWHSGQELLFFM